MEKALSTCFYLFDICSICIQPCLARNNLKLDIYDLVISSRRTTFIFAVGEVDPQSSERQKRQKRDRHLLCCTVPRFALLNDEDK